MKEEEAFLKMQSIISDVEELVESGHYTIENITDEIEDQLVHLWPEGRRYERM